MGFFGHAYAAATYLVKDSTFGWLAFGGNLQQQGASLSVVPKDGARARFFVAPAGVWIVLDAGKITSASYAPASGGIILTLDPADSTTSAARIVVNTTIAKSKHYAVLGGIAERGAITIPLSEHPTSVVIQPQ